MTRFASARDAKEFLVGRIVDEAYREGVSLSEVERNMLYFSETGGAPPDVIDSSHRFDRECDQPEYERKIARLIHNARKRARKEDKQEFDAWSDAIGTLNAEDHYLLVMTRQGGATLRPRGDRLRLWGTAFAIVLGGLSLIYVADRLGFPLTNEFAGMFLWSIAAGTAGAYLLFRAFVGRNRAEAFLNRLLAFFDRTK
jgi:hypothetical protein